jgi:hypothetical protein
METKMSTKSETIQSRKLARLAVEEAAEKIRPFAKNFVIAVIPDGHDPNPMVYPDGSLSQCTELAKKSLVALCMQLEDMKKKRGIEAKKN